MASENILILKYYEQASKYYQRADERNGRKKRWKEGMKEGEVGEGKKEKKQFYTVK